MRVFDPDSTANFCTLVQKKCEAGETILIGTWAVPVFVPCRAAAEGFRKPPAGRGQPLRARCRRAPA
ncbi:MAG: hypothetical protein EBS51_11550 [Planctomycetia bacterium]|nr:hypothetical protein [Planctomycetia bacterium]